jgi:carboxylesterase type B
MVAAVIAGYGLPVEATLATYRQTNPTAGPGNLLASIQSDWYWRIPAIRLAKAYASHGMLTHMYEFAWRSPQFQNRLGACHAIEIPFVFDTLGHATDPLLGPAPPQSLAGLTHAVRHHRGPRLARL